MAVPPNPQEVVTNPDPTKAVIERLELLERTIDQKFKVRDDATMLAREELRSQLTAMNQGISEKFLANKDLVDQLGRANSAALNAALLTQTDSAIKTENSITGLLREMRISFETSLKSVKDNVDTLTARFNLGEGSVAHSVDARREVREEGRTVSDSRSLVIGVIGLIIAIAAFVFGSRLPH